MNYYETLGVSKNASGAEIKTAYRKQALKWHPDRNKSTDAIDKFKQVTKAFEVLSDPKKKEMYDQYGEEAFSRGAYGGTGSAGQSYQQGPFNVYTNFGGEGFEGFDFGGFSDPFEIFEQFFGFQSPFSRQKRTRRDVYEITLTFEEAVNGVKKTMIAKGEEKSFKIPAGVDDNMKIRFSDFDLQVRVKPHPYFKRKGQDIYFEKEISYSLAVLGGVVEVPTVNGTVKLKVRPGTQSGTTVKLRDQGIPYPQTYRKGDQYVVYKINTPSRVSSRAKELLRELEEEI